MTFVSFSFIYFLFLVFIGRILLGPSKKEKSYLILLLAGSFIFYAWHIPIYVFILIFSAAIDYVIGLNIVKCHKNSNHRKILLIASVTTNLGILGFFKYSNFLLQSIQTLCETTGIPSPLSSGLNIVLPLGISFYTFQSLSYTIDVYRGHIRPIGCFWKFLLYISFFPQLVAGPIVRARDFLYQIERKRALRIETVQEGLYLIICGFFLKMVLADNIAPFVDQHWSDNAKYPTGAIQSLFIAFLFSCQIFCDFAGYSNIARGVAYLLGFRLPENFKSPYIAGTFREFWTRWHISLSQWLRDYLYIPLGGSKKTSFRTYLNLFLVMLLGGFWHGAAFNFIVWGGFHGLALIVERLAGLHNLHQDKSESRLLKLVWYLHVQVAILISWIFFRSESLTEGLRMIENIVTHATVPMGNISLFPVGFFVLPVILLHGYAYADERHDLKRLSTRIKPAASALMLYFIFTCYGKSNAFIYFQF